MNTIKQVAISSDNEGFDTIIALLSNGELWRMVLPDGSWLPVDLPPGTAVVSNPHDDPGAMQS